MNREKQQAGNRKRTEAFLAKWKKREQEIRWLYDVKEMSQGQIAEYLGTYLAMVQRVMTALGIPNKGVGRRKGKAHHNYKTGLHNRDYRKIVVKNKCSRCPATTTLGVHHKNDDHFDNRLENLEILCNSCHMSETKRKWWAAKKAGMPLPKSNGIVGWNRKPTAS